MNLNKLLYIGCGSHIHPVYDFPNTKEFVFIESQPFNEFFRGHFDEQMYRHHFIENLLLITRIYGFTLIEERVILPDFFESILNNNQKQSSYSHLQYKNPTLLRFFNIKTQQTIKFFISTPFPQIRSVEICYEVKSCDGIVVCGYHPHRSIVELFNKPITFIGYSGTCFEFDGEYEDLDDHDKNSIVTYLHLISNNQRIQHFDNYFFVKNYINQYDIYNFYDGRFEEILTNFLHSKPQIDISSINDFDGFMTLYHHS